MLRTFVRRFSTLRPEPCQADSLIALGTRRIFGEEHDVFRESCRKFFADKVVPFHNSWEKDGHVPRKLWEDAGEQGLLGVTMPAQYGGPELDITYSTIVWEEQGYTGCTGPGFSLHSEIVMPYILRYGNQEQKDRLLPDMILGKKIGAIAMTEPSAGSDLQGIKTTAVADGDDFIINGSKTYITNGYLSDVVIVVAKTNPAKGAHGISLFLVEDGMKGFIKGRKLDKLGLRAQDTSELYFEDLRVPKSAVLGELNKGFYMLMSELPQERLLIAAMAQASAEACFEWTRSYTKDRKTFGAPLISRQLVAHQLATLKTELAVGRAFVDQCLDLHKNGKLDSPMASMCKYWITDLQNKVAGECVQLHGGNGFMWEYPVTKHYADARVQTIYGGTNEIMRELIIRTL